MTHFDTGEASLSFQIILRDRERFCLEINGRRENIVEGWSNYVKNSLDCFSVDQMLFFERQFMRFSDW